MAQESRVIKCFMVVAAGVLFGWMGAQCAESQESISEALRIPARFVLSTDREAVLTLRGPFRFRVGDDASWSDPILDDSHWGLISGDRSWNYAGYDGLSGVAWYRFIVVLPKGREAYSVRLPHIATAYQLFANGHLIYADGSMPPHTRMYHTVPNVVDLPNFVRTSPTSVTFALRVWQDPLWAAYTPGGLGSAIIIGRTPLIKQQFMSEHLAILWRNSDWFDLAALEFSAAAIALALFMLGRLEREYLWFCILTLGCSLDHVIKLWGRLNPHPGHPIESLESVFFTTYLLASLMFYRKLLCEEKTLALRVVIGACVLWFINTQLAAVPGFSASAENIGELLFTFPVYAWIVCLVIQRAYQGWPDARLLVVPAMLMVGTSYYYQLIFTISTFGHPDVMRYYWKLQNVVYADTKDFAEGVFLIAMLLILGNRFVRNRRQGDRTRSELEAARSVQQLLVREDPPMVVGLQMATAYHPAQEVGGDFYQVVSLGSGATLVMIGDVAGKGVPAALTVAMILGSVRSLSDYIDGPGEILAALNRRLCGRGSNFTTCLVMQISADLKTLRIANAGHLPAYADGCELYTETNLPLGVLEEVAFREAVHPLYDGIHLAVLTDGVPEAMDGRELFGFERVGALTGKDALTIADAARKFGQTDDITVLTIDVERVTGPQGSPVPLVCLDSVVI
jgi:sigma-B regulation protein RsbU (phosphoserine phosphatase)